MGRWPWKILRAVSWIFSAPKATPGPFLPYSRAAAPEGPPPPPAHLPADTSYPYQALRSVREQPGEQSRHRPAPPSNLHLSQGESRDSTHEAMEGILPGGQSGEQASVLVLIVQRIRKPNIVKTYNKTLVDGLSREARSTASCSEVQSPVAMVVRYPSASVSLAVFCVPKVAARLPSS
ncbi:hypothetical protein TREES_T100004158 [Tupaia chinensis]|uniref:Uncharacterized protein n=1 Tax=Tupaia chinensis TaxID=246437 RepID=L9KHS0_TUPCH|nr:hypothetical protein TREES_T100004158 [Tupaia chinensis]